MWLTVVSTCGCLQVAAAASESAEAAQVKKAAEEQARASQTGAADVRDEVRVKRAMLTSANDTIADLKLEVEEALRCAPFSG